MSLTLQHSSETAMKTGGLKQFVKKNGHVVAVVEKIKPELESKSGIKFASIEVIHYRPQLVAGHNYFVEAKGKRLKAMQIFFT